MLKAFALAALLAAAAPSHACICTEEYDPVCGADGKTYSNTCGAACANTEVVAKGKCNADPCVNKPTPGCAKPEEPKGCEWTQAPTDKDGCVVGCPSCVVPQVECICDEQYEPVCSADGKTYSNACEAECDNVMATRKGECEPQIACQCAPFGCTDAWCAEPCRDDQFMYAGGKPCFCDACHDVPKDCICTEEYEPVCGADGKTYSNTCGAACANTEVVAKGKCNADPCVDKPTPGCAKPEEPKGCEWTQAPTDKDGCVVGCPSCVVPQVGCICTMEYKPVCGSDGKVYGNTCVANCANVEVAAKDECVEPLEDLPALDPSLPPAPPAISVFSILGRFGNWLPANFNQTLFLSKLTTTEFSSDEASAFTSKLAAADTDGDGTLSDDAYVSTALDFLGPQFSEALESQGVDVSNLGVIVDDGSGAAGAADAFSTFAATLTALAAIAQLL